MTTVFNASNEAQISYDGGNTWVPWNGTIVPDNYTPIQPRPVISRSYLRECVSCNGSGVIAYEAGTLTGTRQCKACGASGLVWVWETVSG